MKISIVIALLVVVIVDKVSSLVSHVFPGKYQIYSHKLIPSIKKVSHLNAQQLSSDHTQSTRINSNSVFSSSCLIAGTTIGGGFLALPYTTRPLGFIPSCFGLLFAWIYVTLSSLALTKLIFHIKQENNDNNTQNLSIFTISKYFGGRKVSYLASTLFVLLMITTLIAQFSKIGSLGTQVFGYMNIHKNIYILLSAVAMQVLLSVTKDRSTIDTVNNTLSGLMFSSFGILLLFGFSNPSWSLTSLLRHQRYDLLLPTLVRAPAAAAATDAYWAIPLFLQLLVYNEVIPVVADRVSTQKNVNKCIYLGGAVPLLMCVLWSAVALGLTPPTASIIDPVNYLIQGNGNNKVISTAVTTLAFAAIQTTIIGSVLASTQFITDIFPKIKPSISKSLVIFIPALIAMGPASLYYSMTHLAGAFPVILLWGLIPQYYAYKIGPKKRGLALLLASVAMLICNVIRR
jgi:amino acid permease